MTPYHVATTGDHLQYWLPIAGCDKRADVVFVIDESGSIAGTEETFEQSLQIAKMIVAGLNFAGGRTRVGVMTFADTPATRFNLNMYSDQQSILSAMSFSPKFGELTVIHVLIVSLIVFVVSFMCV